MRIEEKSGRGSTRVYLNHSLLVFQRNHSRLVLLLFLAMVVGCRSHVIRVTLTNTSAQPVSNVIVDYPGATFGKNALAAGESYRYVIKPVESGVLQIQFVNAAGVSRAADGPALHKDQEGSIAIGISQDSATVSPALR